MITRGKRSMLERGSMSYIMLGHSPAVVQVGRGCDAGDSVEKPLLLRPRRAISYGRGPSGPRVPSVSCVFSHFARRRRSWF